MPLRACVLGAGSWGTTVAALASHNVPTVLWARRAETADEVNRAHTNERYLPKLGLPHALRATASLEEAVSDADVVVMGVPSHSMRSTLLEVKKHVRPWVPVVSLAKGLEQGSHLRMTQVINDVLPDRRAGVLTGPNLAREIMGGLAAASVLAIDDEMIARQLQDVFHSGLFRVYTNRDVVGCELGGALKNVIAIAVGVADGMEAGLNSRAALITRGLAEITRLGVAMGANPVTFLGLSGVGDLVLTCTGDLSRNRRVGLEIGRGKPVDEVLAGLTQVAEGVRTAKSAFELAQKLGVDMPITTGVYLMLFEGKNPAEAGVELRSRQLKSEYE